MEKGKRCYISAISHFLGIFLRDPLFRVVKPVSNKPWFLHVCRTSLLKTLWEKEKLLITRNFSFFHSVFHPFGELSATFIKLKVVVCKLFLFRRVLNFSLGNGNGLRHRILAEVLTLYRTLVSCNNLRHKVLDYLVGKVRVL